jgi:hypothetical protein
MPGPGLQPVGNLSAGQPLKDARDATTNEKGWERFCEEIDTQLSGSTGGRGAGRWGPAARQLRK